MAAEAAQGYGRVDEFALGLIRMALHTLRSIGVLVERNGVRLCQG